MVRKSKVIIRKKGSSAQIHTATRRDHALEGLEDYVEAIALISSQEGEARVVSLALQMGVSHVAVIKMISKLQKEGYVNSKPYRAIFLTEKGKRLAERVRKRHELVVLFLKALGVSAGVAERDAEGIEHHVSSETMRAFQRYLDSSVSR